MWSAREMPIYLRFPTRSLECGRRPEAEFLMDWTLLNLADNCIFCLRLFFRDVLGVVIADYFHVNSRSSAITHNAVTKGM